MLIAYMGCVSRPHAHDVAWYTCGKNHAYGVGLFLCDRDVVWFVEHGESGADGAANTERALLCARRGNCSQSASWET